MKERTQAKVVFNSGNKLSLEVLENEKKFSTGEIITIEREDIRKGRTMPQNAFFHLMVGRMIPYFDRELDFFSAEWIPAEAKRITNWKLEFLKSTLKREFLTIYVTYEENGRFKEVEFVPSTAALKIGEFIEFMERCIVYFTDAGAPIDAFMSEYEFYKKQLIDKEKSNCETE